MDRACIGIGALYCGAAFYYLAAWKVPSPAVLSNPAPLPVSIEPLEALAGIGLSTVKQPETDDAVLVALKAAFEADDAKAIDILGAALKNSLPARPCCKRRWQEPQ